MLQGLNLRLVRNGEMQHTKLNIYEAKYNEINSPNRNIMFGWNNINPFIQLIGKGGRENKCWKVK